MGFILKAIVPHPCYLCYKSGSVRHGFKHDDLLSDKQPNLDRHRVRKPERFLKIHEACFYKFIGGKTNLNFAA